MLSEISFDQIAVVLEAWDLARSGSDKFDEEFGLVALERLFELQPDTKKVFGFDLSDEIGKSRASVHANAFALLFDSVFQMLGPDIQFTQDILEDLGHKHKAFGVNPTFFPVMGQAVMHALEYFIGSKLTPEQKNVWIEVYVAITDEIVKNMA